MNAHQQSIADALARRGYRSSPHPDRGPPDTFYIYWPAPVEPSRSGASLPTPGPRLPNVCARYIHGTGGVLDWHLLPGDGTRTLIRSVAHLEDLLVALWRERQTLRATFPVSKSHSTPERPH